MDEQAELARLGREVRRLESENEILKRGCGVFREGERAFPNIFRLIEELTAADPKRFKVATVGRLLGVSRSGYCDWAKHDVTVRKARDDEIAEVIARLWAEKGRVLPHLRFRWDARETAPETGGVESLASTAGQGR